MLRLKKPSFIILFLVFVLTLTQTACKKENELLSSPRLIPSNFDYYFSLDGPLFLELVPKLEEFVIDKNTLKHLKKTERIYGGLVMAWDGYADFVLTLIGDFPQGLIQTGLDMSSDWKKVEGEQKYWLDEWGSEIAPFTGRSIYLTNGRMEDVLAIYTASQKNELAYWEQDRPLESVSRIVLKDLETGDFVFLGEGDSLFRERSMRNITGSLQINPGALKEWSLVLNKYGKGFRGFIYIAFADVRQARAFVTSYRLIGRQGSTGGREGSNSSSPGLEEIVLSGTVERKDERIYIRDIFLSADDLAGFMGSALGF